MFLPSGMALVDDKLLVVERRNVAEIDCATGKILNRYPLPQPMFANDITTDQQENWYVSDTRKSAIHKFVNRQFQEWLSSSELANVSRLCCRDDKLICGVTSDHSLKAVDLQTKASRTIVRFAEGNSEGIKLDPQGNYLISHYKQSACTVWQQKRIADQHLLIRFHWGGFCLALNQRLF